MLYQHHQESWLYHWLTSFCKFHLVMLEEYLLVTRWEGSPGCQHVMSSLLLVEMVGIIHLNHSKFLSHLYIKDRVKNQWPSD